MSARRAAVRQLRAVGLAGLADNIAGRWAAFKARDENAAYRRQHPNRAFPDPRLIYEVQSYALLSAFDGSGRDNARIIATALRDAGLKRGARVLDWGCGPCRVLGHMRKALADDDVNLNGCDPMGAAIRWAQGAHPDLTLTAIGRDPPLPYAAQSFDAVYGLSILTHLGERDARAWTAEVARVLKPDGVALLTTHGPSATAALSQADQARFDRGEYLALTGARRGSRAYAAYMNDKAARELFSAHFGAAECLPRLIGLQDGWVLSAPRHA